MAKKDTSLFSGLNEAWPIISAWLAANAALIQGGGNRELAVLQANIEGIVGGTPEGRKMDKRLAELQEEIERQRLEPHNIPTDQPRDWRLKKLSILLRAAEEYGLFTFEKVGSW